MLTPLTALQSTTENSVYHRYAAAAQQREEALCCPVEYNLDYLSVIPQEIIERDYGCGDPTRYVGKGETVVDLGSGGGKLCYILSQVVGPNGRVIGVDCNQEMLALARKYQGVVAERLGYGNVDFRYGMIQDLQLDLDLLGRELEQRPVTDPEQWLNLRSVQERLSRSQPMIPSDSVDCVVSNCVLNLVRQQDRQQLFAEIFRVLKDGGRAAISDIVSDQNVPQHMQSNPELWSGCISGAFREDQFLDAFQDAGFHGIEIAKRQVEPWRTVEGIEFRSMTVVAYKGQLATSQLRNQEVLYRGPFQCVTDDHNQVFQRGMRTAVCETTFRQFQRPPYRGHFEVLAPRHLVSLSDVRGFECNADSSVLESTGKAHKAAPDSSGPCCSPGGSCC